MYCQNCGNEIKKEDKVCSNCGKKNPNHKDTKLMKIGLSITGIIAIALVVSAINDMNNYNNKPVSSNSSISSSNSSNNSSSSNNTTSPTSDNSSSSQTNTKSKEDTWSVENSTTLQGQGIKVTPEQLYDAFDQNEVNANNKYGGKTVIVTGQVLKISVSGGQPIIELAENANEEAFGEVNCYFDSNSSDSSRIANLKKGQKVTVKGVVKKSGFIGVPIYNCSLQ